MDCLYELCASIITYFLNSNFIPKNLSAGGLFPIKRHDLSEGECVGFIKNNVLGVPSNTELMEPFKHNYS